MDPDTGREQQLADEWYEQWKDEQLDRLWAVYEPDRPWNDATSSKETGR
jgi:hypothetical protein